MPEGYCVKCKAKKEISDAVEEVMKNGRKAIKGRCPTCGTVMFKILGGKAVMAETSGTPTNAPPLPASPPSADETGSGVATVPSASPEGSGLSTGKT
jgi:ribosomal protein S27E